MKRDDNYTDLEKCRDKIKSILREYNCSIETDDYHWPWLRDNDTDETIGDINP